MPSLISSLSNSQQRQLFEDLNYLNMAEIKAICKRYSIPCEIWVETGKDTRRKTSDEDRKGVVLKRIRHYLRTGNVLSPTCFPASVVRFAALPDNLDANDRLYYGQYDRKSVAMVELLKNLTEGRFKDGAIARILAREFWAKGEAPTYKQYAFAWLKATEDHKKPNPEWAFLSDRAKGKATASWKRLRSAKAKQVMSVIGRLNHR